MVKVLVIGQVPPPYVGQMISLHQLVTAQFADLRIYHVRMNYSRGVADFGVVKPGKILHLFRVILESSYKILRHRIDVIYYPPGAGTVPLLRDIATLIVLRRFGPKLILAFHASGMCETVASWKGPALWLFKKAFFFPDAVIQKSMLNPPDGAFVKTRTIYALPNGREDQFQRFRECRTENGAPVILFVGLIREDKGVNVLLEAAHLLKQRGHAFQLRFVGEFCSLEYRETVHAELKRLKLEERVEFCGRKIGDEKWARYRNADIFCFPTFYSAESFGNVLIEAMMFELPVVATRWRGIPDVVEDNETGFLTQVKDAMAVANRLEQLIADKPLRVRMGRKGRERYLEKFTVEEYLEQHRQVILEVAKNGMGDPPFKTETVQVTAPGSYQ